MVTGSDGKGTLTRRRLLAGGAGAIATAGRPADASREAERTRPNLVFLLVDQWRASATGYAGDPNAATPNLDALARQSIEFRSAVSVCPVCTPYRAAMLTGRFPTSTGMFLNDLYLPDAEVCLGEILKRAGYDTAYIGKWHLDGHGRSAFIPQQRRQGWDYWKAAECDHDYMHSHYYVGDSAEKHIWPGYDAVAQTADAIEYINARSRETRPFGLVVSFGPPHFPHFPLPPGYGGRLDAGAIRLPPNVPADMKDRARKEAVGYYAHCDALDGCVGDIVTALDAAGVADNTILVFTSDHGEMLGSHGCHPFMKQVPWNESAHVPLLIRHPLRHGSAGRAVDTPLTTPDILPTLLGMAGIPAPRQVEGKDLSHLVRDDTSHVDRTALYMLVSPFGLPTPFSREYRAIRTMRHTYVRGIDGPWLLYDDREDPYQLVNLVADPGSARLMKELDARLRTELRRIGDRFAPREAYVARWGYQLGAGGEIRYEPHGRVQSPHKRQPVSGEGVARDAG